MARSAPDRDVDRRGCPVELLAISGSPSAPSKTVLALRAALERADGYDDVTTGLLNLRDHDVVFSDGRDPADYTGDTRTVIDRVIGCLLYTSDAADE